MAGEQLILDPTSEDASNTQLDITSSTAGYWLISHDYPTPDDDEVWASSADTEGARRANTRPNNRTITCTVRCREAAGTPVIGTIVGKLQQKIGKLNREGGTYKRVLPSGDVIVFDVLAARLKVPADQAWATLKKADVELSFTCAPHGRGASVTLTTHTATAKAPLVFTETAIKGDVPALGSLQITNVTNTKTALYWGIQSRYYSASAGSALFFEAESGVASAATLNAGPAGASGALANKVMKHATVGTSGAVAYGVGPSGTDLNHVGSYRVVARLQADSANTGIVSTQLAWTPGLAVSTISGDWIPITDGFAAIKGSWVIADLGLITIPKAPLGLNYWVASIQSKSTVAADIVYYDWVALIPVDEGSGRGAAASVLSAGSWNATNNFIVGATAVLTDDLGAGTRWTRIRFYEGDYLLIPPAGTEGRTVRIICTLAGGNGLPITNTVVDATNLDAITATLTYTPRYLVVPEP